MMAGEEEDVLQDDHTKRKVFALAGFNSSQEVKVDLVTKIRALGGEVRESPVWSDGVTHVVAANFGHYLEKVMGGLVTGAWVITRRFVEASHQRGQWANTKAYVCDDLVLHHRACLCSPCTVRPARLRAQRPRRTRRPHWSAVL